MRAAQRATRQWHEESRRAGGGSSEAFEDVERGAQRLERALQRVAETERRQAEQQREATQETRRNTQETRRNTEATEENSESREENQRSTERAWDSLGRFTSGTDDNTRSQERNRRTTRQLAAAFEDQGGAARSLAGGMSVLAAAGTSAVVALGAFGAVAAPSILEVVSAQGELSEAWSGLSPLQRASALEVRELKGEYLDLAESFQPEALGAFNTVLRTGHELLPLVGDVAVATSVDVQRLLDRIGGFATGSEMQGFLQHVSVNAPEALDQFGDAAVTTGSLALQLATDLTPVGMSLLTVANGALSLVNGLAHLNPAFAQLAVMGLLLRRPLLGAAAGVQNLGDRMKAGRAATRGMSASQKVLHAVTRAGPALYVAAGVGLAFLAVKAMNAKDAHDLLLESMRIEAGAVGNNLAGHQAYEKQLASTADTLKNKISLELSHYTAAEQKSSDALEDKQDKVSKLRNEYRKTSDRLEEQRKTLATVTRGADLLADQYGITRNEALQLATASGVDLTQAMGENGRITNDAAAKIKNYRVAVEAAKNPTKSVSLALDQMANEALSVKDRMDGARRALEAFFNPSMAVYQATTRVKTGMRELSAALVENRGRIDGTSAASLRLQEQFAQQLQATGDLWLSTSRLTGGEAKATQVMREQLPVLYALAGNNKEARRQVDALARSTGNATGATRTSRDAFLKTAKSMGIQRDRAEQLWRELDKIPKRVKSEVDIFGEGHWESAPWATTGGPAHLIPRAKGGPIPSVGPESSRAYDSVPALLRVDEHVWTPEEVDAVGGHGAMYRLRAMAKAGKLQGFRSGGEVALDRRGSTSAVMDDVFQPIDRGYSGFVTSMMSIMAAIWKKFSTSGGPVVAAARTQLGVPYVWGGTAWNQGLDCSGLTSQAWQRGAGVWIGRTTYQQYPNSSPIGSPRPAALGFPHLGHVVLATGRGTIIEAPYTGANVRERSISRNYEWRWPDAARFAEGGEVDRARLGRRFLNTSSRSVILDAKALGVAGDPGGLGLTGFADGGWVRGTRGRDKTLIAATGGEFVVNEDQAAKYPGLVEAINNGRVGRSMVSPLRSAIPVRLVGGGASAPASGRDVAVNVGPVVVQDKADADMIAARVGFAVRGAAL